MLPTTKRKIGWKPVFEVGQAEKPVWMERLVVIKA
jgi:hypothetical protein